MAIRDEINKFYVDYIGRPGEAAGLDYWESVISSGRASLGDVQNLIANSAEAQGLLGAGTTTGGTTKGATTGATTGGLLGGTQAASNRGMSRAEAVSLVQNAYQNILGRPAEQAGVDYWADFLTNGTQTWDQVLANIRRSAEAGTPQAQNAQAGIRQVPFGSQPVGGILYQTSQMPSAAAMPSFQQFTNPNAVADAFQQSLAYQGALPSMIQPFNPANIPATYQQIAQPRQRLDITNVQIPDWLRMAAAKDEKRADAMTESLLRGSTGTTSGITTTTPGVIGTTGGGTVGGGTVGGGAVGGGGTGGRTAADLQAFNQLLGQTYQTALGRAPETAGTNYWTGLYSSGTPFQDIVSAIMNSPEAQGRSSGGLLAGPE